MSSRCMRDGPTIPRALTRHGTRTFRRYVRPSLFCSRVPLHCTGVVCAFRVKALAFSANAPTHNIALWGLFDCRRAPRANHAHPARRPATLDHNSISLRTCPPPHTPTPHTPHTPHNAGARAHRTHAASRTLFALRSPPLPPPPPPKAPPGSCLQHLENIWVASG